MEPRKTNLEPSKLTWSWTGRLLGVQVVTGDSQEEVMIFRYRQTLHHNIYHHHHHNHPHHHHHHNYKHKFCSFKTNSAGTQIFVTMIISSSLTIISHSCKSTLHHCQPSASSPLLLSSFSSLKSIPAIRIDGIIISITVIGDQLIIIIFVSKPSITAVPSSSPVVIPPITTHSRQCPVNSVNCPSR